MTSYSHFPFVITRFNGCWTWNLSYKSWTLLCDIQDIHQSNTEKTGIVSRRCDIQRWKGVDSCFLHRVRTNLIWWSVYYGNCPGKSYQRDSWMRKLKHNNNIELHQRDALNSSQISLENSMRRIYISRLSPSQTSTSLGYSSQL